MRVSWSLKCDAPACRETLTVHSLDGDFACIESVKQHAGAAGWRVHQDRGVSGLDRDFCPKHAR